MIQQQLREYNKTLDVEGYFSLVFKDYDIKERWVL